MSALLLTLLLQQAAAEAQVLVPEPEPDGVTGNWAAAHRDVHRVKEPQQEETIIIIDDDDDGDDVAPTTIPAEGTETIIIDATEVSAPGAGYDADSVIVVEDDASADEGWQAPALDASRTWLKGELATRLLSDWRFEKTGEDVVEWWTQGRLRLDHRRSRSLRGIVDARVRWGLVAEEPPPEETYLLFNARDGKWTYEAELREAFIEWRPADFEVRVGQQIFVWGKNELLAPADLLNPMDLRYDILAALDSPKDAKVPVFALDGSYWRGESGVELVILPFFAANKTFVLGRDFALATAGSPLERQVRAVGSVHPSIEDELQQGVSGTEVPEESPFGASLALRGVTRLAGWDVALTAYYGWDRTPWLRVDADLMLLMRESGTALASPQELLSNQELQRATVSVQQKVAVGQQLVRADYKRQWVFALEASGVIGDFVARADVGFSPGSIYYTADFEPVRRRNATGVVGLEYTRGEQWYGSLTGYGLMVFKPPESAMLVGLENTREKADKRDMAALYGLSANLRWRWQEEGLELTALGLYHIKPKDWVASFKVSYEVVEPHDIGLGAIFFEGPDGTTVDRFDRNDFWFVQYRVTW